VIQYKCPCCGYDNNKSNPSRKIAELRRNRSKSTRLIMRKAVSAIATNIPSDNNVTKEYFFYQGVSEASDEVVKYGIGIFLNSNAFYKGKGFKYLTHIILNHNSNRDRLKQFERQMIGKPPSVVELKED
tara:strand:- start:351 stop:737 length:387 start_codon:yes stop_codon:yes gene_type:complete